MKKTIIIIAAILLATFIFLSPGLMSVAKGAEIVENGATSQSFYMVMLDRDGDPNTSITVTTLDMYYVTDQNSVATKIDCTDLGSENAAYASGGCYEMGTSGLYRFDFPDAAFRHGVNKRVNLWIDDAVTGTRTAYLCVMLSPAVDVVAVDGDAGAATTLETTFDTSTAADAWEASWVNTTWAGNIDDFFDGTGLSIGTFTTDAIPLTDIEDAVDTAIASVSTGGNIHAHLKVADDNAVVDVNQTDVADGVDASTKVIAIETDTEAFDTVEEAKALFWASQFIDIAAGGPPVDPNVFEAYNYMYTAWRNKTVTTSTGEVQLYRDDGIEILCKRDASDDGTDFTQGKHEAE